jgi:AcrR family transcriptional regulator
MDAMAQPVKRSYDTSRRRALSAQTRQRIIDAARERILEVGYRATTIAAIAAKAGVSVDTVYELVGRKPVLLREIIEQMRGPDHAGVDDQEFVKAIREEPDAATKLVIYAGAVTRIQQRMAPIFLALNDAASTESEARVVWNQINQQRADNLRELAREVRDAGGLRAGLSIEEAADIIWATSSSAVYALLTLQRGWSTEAFEAWLVDSWRRLLIE